MYSQKGFPLKIFYEKMVIMNLKESYSSVFLRTSIDKRIIILFIETDRGFAIVLCIMKDITTCIGRSLKSALAISPLFVLQIVSKLSINICLSCKKIRSNRKSLISTGFKKHFKELGSNNILGSLL